MSDDISEWLPAELIDGITTAEIDAVIDRLEQLAATGIKIEEYRIVTFAQMIQGKFRASIWRTLTIKRLARLGPDGRQVLAERMARHDGRN